MKSDRQCQGVSQRMLHNSDIMVWLSMEGNLCPMGTRVHRFLHMLQRSAIQGQRVTSNPLGKCIVKILTFDLQCSPGGESVPAMMSSMSSSIESK